MNVRYRGLGAGLVEVLNLATMFEDWGFSSDQAIGLAILAHNVRISPEKFR